MVGRERREDPADRCNQFLMDILMAAVVLVSVGARITSASMGSEFHERGRVLHRKRASKVG